MRNSTIRQKLGCCPICDNGKKVPLIGGFCNNHYWQNVRLKSVSKQNSKEDINDDEGIATLKADLDIIYSQFIRLSAVGKDGLTRCFICGKEDRWQDAQNMHYIKRGNSFLRFDPRNTKCGCKNCNEYKDGNYLEYTKQLEKENHGVTSILLEEANIVYKFTRDELKTMIGEYAGKVKILKEKLFNESR